MPDWRPQLANVSAPVTFVTGAMDTKFDAIARGLVSDCHDARHVVIEGAGHNPLLERPDAVAALLRQV
jgi:pimeloyl-ACP methyl ester carboxylesterase